MYQIITIILVSLFISCGQEISNNENITPSVIVKNETDTTIVSHSLALIKIDLDDLLKGKGYQFGGYIDSIHHYLRLKKTK